MDNNKQSKKKSVLQIAGLVLICIWKELRWFAGLVASSATWLAGFLAQKVGVFWKKIREINLAKTITAFGVISVSLTVLATVLAISHFFGSLAGLIATIVIVISAFFGKALWSWGRKRTRVWSLKLRWWLRKFGRKTITAPSQTQQNSNPSASPTRRSAKKIGGLLGLVLLLIPSIWLSFYLFSPLVSSVKVAHELPGKGEVEVSASAIVGLMAIACLLVAGFFALVKWLPRSLIVIKITLVIVGIAVVWHFFGSTIAEWKILQEHPWLIWVVPSAVVGLVLLYVLGRRVSFGRLGGFLSFQSSTPDWVSKLVGAVVFLALCHLLIFLLFTDLWIGWLEDYPGMLLTYTLAFVIIIFLFSLGGWKVAMALVLLLIVGFGAINDFGGSLGDQTPKKARVAVREVQPRQVTGTIVWLSDPSLRYVDLGNTRPGDRERAQNIINNEDVLEFAVVSPRSPHRHLWHWNKRTQRGYWKDLRDGRKGDLVIHFQVGPNQFEGAWYSHKTGLCRPFRLTINR